MRIVDVLTRHGVDFIVIGGEAAVLLGSPLPTFDTDLCYRRTSENLQRLAAALREMHPTLRGAPPDLPFRLDAESLALGSNFTFNTDFGPLDLLGWVEPLGAYDELARNAELITVGNRDLRVIGLDDLITIKKHLRRNKDLAAIVQLEALKQIRESSKGELE